ncbi:hypothetical protein MYCTH_100435 [Thermothelomyces thermophilus ATCC 42464]|uniref:Apple domain-containing protein n=1 Tax=Thermothelomyces thermophilus (strain ATCC 42464 / BCRC 31852 / DSM 1799) TaxID=573729 RepID=G2QAP2_THET4|nr:uncharacterized protein MYCTH_100435 [Thermothelomyces thermophilus ATCC 42464]AEO56738.1 hypothetical protein MYCTH_100435 [Thermothelomyces thermophilus ATCC 42464]
MALAAPSRSDNLVKHAIHRRNHAEIPATSTRDAPASACTNGMPASKQHPAGYPIDDYTLVTPDSKNWTSYAVAKDWYSDHFVSGPHAMSFSHESDPYGPFKCQYTCNAEPNCNAYFAWYENIETNNEHINCVLFDAVIPTSIFVEANGTIASGAYDRLCNHSS